MIATSATIARSPLSILPCAGPTQVTLHAMTGEVAIGVAEEGAVG